MRPWIDGVQIDREIAEAYPCEECGAKMTYRADYEEGEEGEKPTYRAFAVCVNPECGNECEF